MARFLTRELLLQLASVIQKVPLYISPIDQFYPSYQSKISTTVYIYSSDIKHSDTSQTYRMIICRDVEYTMLKQRIIINKV
jgi:hypothetical protein